MARMPRNGFRTLGGSAPVVHVTLSPRSAPDLDRRKSSKALADKVIEVLGKSGDAIQETEDLLKRLDQQLQELRQSQSRQAGSALALPKPAPSGSSPNDQSGDVLEAFSDQETDDIPAKTRYSKSTPGRELHIIEESQQGGKSTRTDAGRRDRAWQEIEKVSADHQAARLEATKILAATLTPIVNEYIELSDQTTVDAQRELCEYVRDLCHANHLAVKCPRTGIETLVFATPRLGRKSPLRVSFRHGRDETHGESHLHSVVLVPNLKVAEEHHRKSVDRKDGQEITR